MNRLLRYIRIAVSLFCMAVITASAAGWTSGLMLRLEWVSEIQFVPLVLSVSVVTMLMWLLVSYLFGRVYCSSVCPLGTLQDIFIRLPRLTANGRRRRVFRYAEPFSTLRYSTLAVVTAALLAGVTSLMCMLAPDMVYTKMIRLMASDLTGAALIAFGFSMALVAAIAVMSARKGRLWCNTLCPVGSLLGIASRRAVLHFDINTDLCTDCRRCEYVCKAQCINLADHVVDGSRCVNCFDCVNVCPDDAITYTTRRHRLSDPMMQKVGE